MSEVERLAFIAHWLDNVSGVKWTFQLMVYPKSNEVEMFDCKTRKTFLRKTRVELKPERIYVGARVTIFGRQLNIHDYGDEYTRKALESVQQRTLAMIKPDAIQHAGSIIQAVEEEGFLISKLRICHLTKAEACQFYDVHAGKPFFDKLTDFMSSGCIMAIELLAQNAIAKWRALIGPTNSETARQDAPKSLRARFGTDGTCNACHGSDAVETAEQESNFFFGPGGRHGVIEVSPDTTLAIIKPHALADHQAGAILTSMAQAGLQLRAMELFSVGHAAAGEFYEVYRGVVPPSEFSNMVDELTSGPCLVAEVSSREQGSCVEHWREVCGPSDPEVARALRPKTLRARFGKSKKQNAVHCTDLEDDGPLEVNYFFKILQASGG
eukprot:jgi/Ulvmu1/184/UM001_0188.1